MKFKYAVEHSGCAEKCPPETAKPAEEPFDAYRLIAGTTISEKDFLPQAKLERGFETRPVQCTDHALSFLMTRKQARKQYARLKKRVPKWPLSHSAKTVITPTDGCMTKPSSRTGHFDLHESAAAAMHNQATYCEDCSSCDSE